MDNLREQAKRHKDKGNYSEAVNFYSQIYIIDSDKWIAWEYSYCLKQLGQVGEAIEICKNTYKNHKEFKFNNDLLAWLLFEKYYKEIKLSYNADEIKKLYNIAIFVSEIAKQSEDSPYERVILKTIKIIKDNLNNNSKENYRRILALIDKLDSNMLSCEEKSFQKNGRDSKYQSDKESFYATKTKALFELEEYQLCKDCCEEALSKLEIFHHNNDIWFKARIANCIAKMGDIDTAITELKSLYTKMNHWSIPANIGELYTELNDIDNSLLFLCRAALTNDPHKMKVSLYANLVNLLLKNGQDNIVYQHSLLIKAVRLKEGWSIPYTLQSTIDKYEEHYSQEQFDEQLCKEFWRNTIIKLLGEKSGVVTNIIPNGKIGFVACESGSYFLKTSSVNGEKVVKGDKIVFCLIDSFDAKKNVYTKEAAYIKKCG